MLMYLETLFSLSLGERANKFLSILMMHTNMLLFSINDMLDLKLIEENNFMMKPQVFPLRDTFNFISEIIQQTSFESQDISYQVATVESLESQLEPNQFYESGTLPKSVIGDKVRLTQVLINLAKLALKFQRQSGGKVEIFVAYDFKTNQVKVCITNSAMRPLD